MGEVKALDLVDIYTGMICADVLRFQDKELNGSEFVDKIREHVRDLFKVARLSLEFHTSKPKVNQDE